MKTIYSPGLMAGWLQPPKYPVSRPLSFLLALTSVYGQVMGVSRPPMRPANPLAALPPVLYVCAANCANWRLQTDGTYLGDGANGKGYAVLTVESFSPRFVVHRIDPPDAKGARLTAEYVGKLAADGKGIAGIVTFTFPYRPKSLPKPATEFTVAWEGIDATKRSVSANPAYTAKISAAQSTKDANYASSVEMVNKIGPLILQSLGDLNKSEDPLDGDVAARISDLESRVAQERSQCHPGRREPDPHCGNAEDAKRELDAVYSAVLGTINDLREQIESLTPQCKAGRKNSCAELDKVTSEFQRFNRIWANSMFSN